MSEQTLATRKSSLCPCGSEKEYDACCGPLHQGRAHAQTAQALMRSRYSAFVLHNAEYLRQTWHPRTRPATLDLGDPRACKWLGLTIVATCQGEADDEQGTVEFIARYKVQGRAQRLHERSRFLREQGRWHYLDGDILA